MERIVTEFGYMEAERLSVGARALPYSFAEAVREAQARGCRVLTSAEYQKAIEHASRQLAMAGSSSDGSACRTYRNLLLDLYGMKLEGVGYAGARELTATIVDLRGPCVQEVVGFGSSERYPQGPVSHVRWLAQLIEKTREMQHRAKARMDVPDFMVGPFIDDFDPALGLPSQVSAEPNIAYHNAVFSISPRVFEEGIGVVVRGQHHAVGEPCIKYDTFVMPLSYKDIMLGHRTVSDANKSNLMALTGIGGALIYELANRPILGRISSQEAARKISEYTSSKAMSRRAFNSSIALFSLYLTGCGGGSSNGTSPPPPPTLPQKFEYSGSVSKRIANDGSKIGQGEVVLEGAPGTFKADVDSAGNFRITSIPSGTYRRTTRDKSGDSLFVQQIESAVTISSNLANQNYSVIERGDNRFDVPFDENFQTFYSKMAQRNHQTSLGIIKWGNAAGEKPRRYVVVENTVPSEGRDRYMNLFRQVANEDPPKMSGGRISSLQVNFGIAADFDMEDSFYDGPTISDYPVLSGRKIIRQRTRNNPSILNWNDRGLQFVKSHDNVGHGLGYADFNNDICESVMNNTPGKGTLRPVASDEVVGVCAYSIDVHPGNTPPDTNP
jgi:hypothetical protein